MLTEPINCSTIEFLCWTNTVSCPTAENMCLTTVAMLQLDSVCGAIEILSKKINAKFHVNWNELRAFMDAKKPFRGTFC